MFKKALRGRLGLSDINSDELQAEGKKSNSLFYKFVLPSKKGEDGLFH